MATKAPPAKSAPSAKPQLVPPEERFWKHYSPHQEFPLSTGSSVLLHLLAAGLLALAAIYIHSGFTKPKRDVPLDVVRLDLGGSGGKPDGAGDGPGAGHGPENVQQGEPSTAKPGPVVEPRPDLKVAANTPPRIDFSDNAKRFIRENNTTAMAPFRRLNDSVRRKLHDGLNPGKGAGGPGKGGGEGSGTGTGAGKTTGGGKLDLNEREKRMLRWTMTFRTDTGPDYLNQLRGLGAILAIPIAEGPSPEFRIVRNLRPGARLLEEDLAKINRIYWVDEDPKNVGMIMSALGHPELRPSRFIAFMPLALEKKLFEMEHTYLKKRHPGATENDIHETKFNVRRTRSSYEPYLVSLTLKKKS